MAKVKLEAILGKSGKKTIYSKSNFKGPMDVQINQVIDGIKSEFYPKKQLVVTQPPPPNLPPIVSAGDDLKVDVGQLGILLDGSASDPEGRLVRSEWIQKMDGSTELVTLTPDPNDPTNATFNAPNVPCSLLFEFQAEDDRALISKDYTIVTVGEIIPPPPPPPGTFPIPIAWYYSSDMVLSHPGTFPTKKRSPFDPVLLFSNASSVKNHTVKDGWLIINTGDQYGRTYWELYEIPEFKTTNLGFETAFAGVFKMTSLKNDSNFSVKLGDHGTEGYLYDGEKFVGGGGVSFHAGEIQSKFEWLHGGGEGPELSFKYLDGKKLEVGVAYPFLITWVGDKQANEITAEAWIQFDGEWQHTMKDRVWEKDNLWDEKVANLPDKALDKPDAIKGPGYLKFDHIWTRANEFDVLVQSLQAGVPVR